MSFLLRKKMSKMILNIQQVNTAYSEALAEKVVASG